MNWALREVLNGGARRVHRSTLRQPGRYWLATLLKLVPGLWKAPVALTLRDGTTFRVQEFMTLYIHREIFVDGCYDVSLGTAGTPNVVDVGANTGLFALRMHRLHPDAIVHCYEPMPSNFDQLRWNLAANGMHDCAVHPEGVGGTGRTERLLVHRRNVGGHSIHAAIADGAESIEIRLTGIAEVIDRLGPGGVPCSSSTARARSARSSWPSTRGSLRGSSV